MITIEITIKEEELGLDDKVGVTVHAKARGETVTENERIQADRIMQFLHDDALARCQSAGAGSMAVNDPESRIKRG